MFYFYRRLIHQNLNSLQNMVSRLFFMMIWLVVLQTGSVFAQVGAANLVAHGVLALMGGGREAKQEKIIDQSTTKEKISGSNVAVLRVKESDIKSKAKSHIIALQNRLTQYDSLYKNNQPLVIPKNDSDVIAIQTIDENWPTEYYVNELRAYKRYALQQKQKLSAAPADSSQIKRVTAIRKDTAGAKL